MLHRRRKARVRETGRCLEKALLERREGERLQQKVIDAHLWAIPTHELKTSTLSANKSKSVTAALFDKLQFFSLCVARHIQSTLCIILITYLFPYNLLDKAYTHTPTCSVPDRREVLFGAHSRITLLSPYETWPQLVQFVGTISLCSSTFEFAYLPIDI